MSAILTTNWLFPDNEYQPYHEICTLKYLEYGMEFSYKSVTSNNEAIRVKLYRTFKNKNKFLDATFKSQFTSLGYIHDKFIANKQYFQIMDSLVDVRITSNYIYIYRLLAKLSQGETAIEKKWFKVFYDHQYKALGDFLNRNSHNIGKYEITNSLEICIGRAILVKDTNTFFRINKKWFDDLTNR